MEVVAPPLRDPRQADIRWQKTGDERVFFDEAKEGARWEIDERKREYEYHLR